MDRRELDRYNLARQCKRNARNARRNMKTSNDPVMKEYWRKCVQYWNIRAKGDPAIPPEVPEQYK